MSNPDLENQFLLAAREEDTIKNRSSTTSEPDRIPQPQSKMTSVYPNTLSVEHSKEVISRTSSSTLRLVSPQAIPEANNNSSNHCGPYLDCGTNIEGSATGGGLGVFLESMISQMYDMEGARPSGRTSREDTLGQEPSSNKDDHFHSSPISSTSPGYLNSSNNTTQITSSQQHFVNGEFSTGPKTTIRVDYFVNVFAGKRYIVFSFLVPYEIKLTCLQMM